MWESDKREREKRDPPKRKLFPWAEKKLRMSNDTLDGVQSLFFIVFQLFILFNQEIVVPLRGGDLVV